MISAAFFGFTLWLAFAFATPREAFTWLGSYGEAYGYALTLWPFFAIFEGTIGVEIYGGLWRKFSRKAAQ